VNGTDPPGTVPSPRWERGLTAFEYLTGGLLTAASIHGFFARDADLGDFILAVWLGPAGLLLLFSAVAMTRRSPVRWACQALPILWLAGSALTYLAALYDF
jgi:hypothetical protein